MKLFLKSMFVSVGLFLIQLNAVKAQIPGFLGEKNLLGAGITYNPPFTGYNDEYIRDNAYKQTLPPKFQIEYERVIGTRKSVFINASHYSMMNSRFHVTFEEIEDAYHMSWVTDTFKLRSNMQSINIGMKFYKELAPISKYFSMSIGVNYCKSKVYPTTYIQQYELLYANDYDGWNDDRTKIGEALYNDTIFVRKDQIISFSITRGYKKIVNEHIVLDYGVRGHIFFGKYHFRDDDDDYYYGSSNINSLQEYNHRENIDEIIAYIHNKRAYLTHIFELYLTVQFSK